jgi:transcriptional regulator with XRE-family HTH domain
MNKERLRDIREKRGLSKRKLSQMTGIAEMQLVRYEHGTSVPTAERLMILAEVLEITTDYLLGLSDNPLGNFSGDMLNTAEQELLAAFRRDGWRGVFRLGVDHITDLPTEKK